MRNALEPTPDPAWTLEEHGYDPWRERHVELRFAIGNGFLGVRGAREVSRGPMGILDAYLQVGFLAADLCCRIIRHAQYRAARPRAGAGRRLASGPRAFGRQAPAAPLRPYALASPNA